MSENGYSTNCLTAIRFFAASLVVVSHGFAFIGLHEPVFLGRYSLGHTGVWIFFSISGYLISKSWNADPNLQRFLLKRSLRIFPALWLCVLITIVVIGLLVSTKSMTDYFASSGTWRYLNNMALYITFQLPGVFETNPVKLAVNGSLWSLPAEFTMYIFVAIVGFLTTKRWVWIVSTIAFLALANLWAFPSSKPLVVYATDVRQIVMCGSLFLVGVVIERYQLNRFMSWQATMIVSAMWWASTFVPEVVNLSTMIFLPWVTLSLGLTPQTIFSRIDSYDYSYGLYLYAFPIQQAIVHFKWAQEPWTCIALAFFLILPIAAVSWHLLEKRMLTLKPKKQSASTLNSSNA